MQSNLTLQIEIYAKNQNQSLLCKI